MSIQLSPRRKAHLTWATDDEGKLDLTTSPTAQTPSSIAPKGVHVWRISLSADSAHLMQLRSLLSEAEKARAQRFRTPQLQDRFIVAHAALRHILAQYSHQPASELQFSVSPYGKPSLISETGLAFSLSHSQAWALCAVTLRRAVGVDIEFVQALPDMEALARRSFSIREQTMFSTLADADKPLGFYHCWTRKEAFVKALGTGLSHPLDSFDVTLCPDEEARFIEIRTMTDAPWSLMHLEPAPGYVGAVAVEGECNQIVTYSYGIDLG